MFTGKDTNSALCRHSASGAAVQLHTGPKRVAAVPMLLIQLMLKAYFLRMVWACHKYLVIKSRVSVSGGGFVGMPCSACPAGAASSTVAPSRG